MNRDKLRRAIELLHDVLDEDLGIVPAEPASVQPAVTDNKPVTWQQLSGAFANRYQAARGLVWTSGPHVQSLIDIAEALNHQPGDRVNHARTLLDNFFADDFAKKVDFPPAMLSKQFGKFLSPPEEDGKVDLEDRQRRAQLAERRHQEAKRKAEADHARRVAEKAAQEPELVKAAVGELKDWLGKGEA